MRSFATGRGFPATSPEGAGHPISASAFPLSISMPQERFEKCKALLDQGQDVAALVNLVCLWRDNPVRGNEVYRLLDAAFKKCQSGYADTRSQLIQWIQETEAPEEVDACLTMLVNFRDYKAVRSCRDLKVKVDQSNFYMGFADYIDHHLTLIAGKENNVYMGESQLKDTKTKVYALSGSYLAIVRDEAEITSPLIEADREIVLGTPVWATAFDPVTGRYILTLPEEDRVLGINAETLELEMELKCPGGGLRGIAVHPGLRRGFFNAEFNSTMVSFDLDTFEVRKEITGFSRRPERIYTDLNTNTLVTGNLGLPTIFPSATDYQSFLLKPSPEGNIKTSRTMNLVDMEKEKVVETLPTGRRPTAVDISGKYVAAGNFYDNTLTLYERSNLKKHSTIPLEVIQNIHIDYKVEDGLSGQEINFSKAFRSRIVEGIAILEKRNLILVSGYDACFLIVIDIEKKSVIGTVFVDAFPFDVVADEAEKFAYVSCNKKNSVSVVDLDKMMEVYRLRTGESPQDLNLVGNTLLIPHATGVTLHDVGGLDSRTE
jgi:DNA-binding beta-propeller fold protein YncE